MISYFLGNKPRNSFITKQTYVTLFNSHLSSSYIIAVKINGNKLMGDENSLKYACRYILILFGSSSMYTMFVGWEVI